MAIKIHLGDIIQSIDTNHHRGGNTVTLSFQAGDAVADEAVTSLVMEVVVTLPNAAQAKKLVRAMELAFENGKA